MDHVNDNPLWVERYRPRSVKDTILPQGLRTMFESYVEKGVVPNLLLAGSPGTGKTTIARAVLEDLGNDYIIINGSLERNIDTLRVDITQYATTQDIYGGGRKYVILDEADHLNPNTFQPALRNFSEDYSNNCGFILTANYKHKIIEPLRSRFSLVDFRIPKEERAELMKAFIKRLFVILETEGVPFDKAAVIELVKKHFPDQRRVINELQKYAGTGKIDSGILANIADASVKELYELMKAREFQKLRKWVADNSDMDTTELFARIYENTATYVQPNTIPAVVLILAKYQYQAAFAANPELNNLAAIVEIMMEAKFL